jgi:TolA-binding protein
MVLLAAVVLAGCASNQGVRWMHADSDADLAAALQLMADGRYDEAAGHLASLAATAQAQGRPDITSKALFWQGYCNEKTDHPDDAMRLYAEVIKSYAGTPAARQAAERTDLLLQKG